MPGIFQRIVVYGGNRILQRGRANNADMHILNTILFEFFSNGSEICKDWHICLFIRKVKN